MLPTERALSVTHCKGGYINRLVHLQRTAGARSVVTGGLTQDWNGKDTSVVGMVEGLFTPDGWCTPLVVMRPDPERRTPRPGPDQVALQKSRQEVKVDFGVKL